jgi:hypothetical protein
MVFKITVFLFQTAFALQIEAPKEIEEHILAYSSEAGAQNENAILRVNIAKTGECSNYFLKLIDKNSGKTIKETEMCSADLPNIVLQNAVFEIFGHKAENAYNANSGLSGNVKTILFGAAFAVAGVLLYYSNPPKPVYGYGKISEEEK